LINTVFVPVAVPHLEKKEDAPLKDALELCMANRKTILLLFLAQLGAMTKNKFYDKVKEAAGGKRSRLMNSQIVRHADSGF